MRLPPGGLTRPPTYHKPAQIYRGPLQGNTIHAGIPEIQLQRKTRLPKTTRTHATPRHVPQRETTALPSARDSLKPAEKIGAGPQTENPLTEAPQTPPEFDGGVRETAPEGAMVGDAHLARETVSYGGEMGLQVGGKTVR